MMRQNTLRRMMMAAVPLAATVLLSQNAVWAGPVRLDRIDFEATPLATEINLFINAPGVTYRPVAIDDNKLIVDIDQVTSNGTISTHFSSSSERSTISNVVIQPLNDHAIRLIVRGEHLATPKIAFQMPRVNAPTAKTKPKSASGAISQESLISESLGDGPEEASNTRSLDNAPVIHQAPPQTISQRAIGEDKTTAEPISAPDVRRPVDPMSNINTIIADWRIAEITQYALAGLLLLGLGWFVRRKIQEMAIAQEQSQLDLLLAQRAEGQPIGFRAMAEAYRQDQGKGQERPVGFQAESPSSPLSVEPITEPPRMEQSKKAAKNTDSVIGLRSLSQQLNQQVDELYEQTPVPQFESQPAPLPSRRQPARPTIETAPELPPATPAPAAPPRQVMNQYMQQQHRLLQQGKQQAKQPSKQATPNQAPAASQARKRKVSDEALRQELNRTQDLKRQAQSAQKANPAALFQATLKASEAAGAMKKPAAKAMFPQLNKTGQPVAGKAGLPAGKRPQASGNPQAPLSGNPEVLSFLRNVAELMEQDGKPQIAKSIQKTLRPQ